MVTAAPCLASSVAIARPMPLSLPVTTATLFSSVTGPLLRCGDTHVPLNAARDCYRGPCTRGRSRCRRSRVRLDVEDPSQHADEHAGMPVRLRTVGASGRDVRGGDVGRAQPPP